METKSTQQEILLFTNTRFSAREWNGKQDGEKEKELTSKEKLEEACWNGLVPEVLPEICQHEGSRLILWQINVANTFLDLRFSQKPDRMEKEFAVNPYVFMEVQRYN